MKKTLTTEEVIAILKDYEVNGSDTAEKTPELERLVMQKPGAAAALWMMLGMLEAMREIITASASPGGVVKVGEYMAAHLVDGFKANGNEEVH